MSDRRGVRKGSEADGLRADGGGAATAVDADGDAGATDRGAATWIDRLTSRREFGVLVGFLVLLALIAVTQPGIFFDWSRMSGVVSRLLRRIAPYVIIGTGMTYLIVGGEFDLSVGSMYAVGGISFAILLSDFRLTLPVAVLVVILLGILVGLTNGVIVTKVGVPSLIATIGMLSILRGIAFYLTGGGSVQTPSLPTLGVFGGEVVVGPLDVTVPVIGTNVFVDGVAVSYQIFWSVGILVVFAFLLRRTRFGHHVFATGDDPAAAEMTGIDTDRVKIVNFVITAALAAFAGAVSISYFGSMFATAGSGFELLIIAAVVIGGTNLFGGEGSLTGTFLGALVIGIIPILLVLNGFAVEIQELLTGVVIIVAVVLDILFRR